MTPNGRQPLPNIVKALSFSRKYCILGLRKSKIAEISKLWDEEPRNRQKAREITLAAIRSLIGSRIGEELYTGASRALRSAAKVEVFEENL